MISRTYCAPYKRGLSKQSTATWNHSHACRSTHGVALCKRDQCEEYVQPAGVMFVEQESVELEWGPPNECMQGHDIKGVMIHHLPHIRPELISSEAEPVVVHRQANQSFLTADDAVLSISSNISSCQRYRVEIGNVYYDLHQGQIPSVPLIQELNTKPRNKVSTSYRDGEVVLNKPAGSS